MRLSVYTDLREESNLLRTWIEAYCKGSGFDVDLRCVNTESDFDKCISPGAHQALLIGRDDTGSFLAARRAREQDQDCRIIMLCDSERYAVRSYRLHVSDYLLRPLEKRRLYAALDRLFGR
jgi:DNA-binding response OmpR family regulator